MFKIRSEQIRVFQPNAEDAFVNRVTEYLRANHREDSVRLPQTEMRIAELSEADLREMVKGGIGCARGYGIEWKSNLKAFVTMMFIAAPNFNEYEKAAAFLSDKTTPAEERIDKLTDALTDEDWAGRLRKFTIRASGVCRWRRKKYERVFTN